jgi:hypothetical protein
MNREDVYKLIDGERNYQNHLGPDRTAGKSHDVGAYLTMLETYCRQARDSWTYNSGDRPALVSVRKIAAIAVHCMEEHGGEARIERR